jgi:hypothetical protein
VAVESRSIIASYSNIAYVNLLIQDEQRALSRSIVASRTGLTTLREINGAAGYPPRCRSILVLFEACVDLLNWQEQLSMEAHVNH